MSAVAKRLDGSRCHLVRIKAGLGLSRIVLHGDPAPSKIGTAPHFWPMSVVAKRSLTSATAEHFLFHFRRGSILGLK